MKELVTVLCTTYNHKDYIAQALDSFLMQKTKFDFKIVVHDDKSTDGTTEILMEYEKNNPSIQVVYEKENQYSKGDYSFINDMFYAAKGKYIAFCEGDDFWTDDKKLQKQVDFMEQNSDYALCFHPVRVFYENSEKPDYIFPEIKQNDITLENLLRSNYIQTNSVLYRRQNYKELPSRIIPSDWYMHLYHAQYGKIGYQKDVMSAYRRQPGGVWWDATNDISNLYAKYGGSHIAMFFEVLQLYGSSEKYSIIVLKNIGTLFNSIAEIDTSELNIIGRFFDNNPKWAAVGFRQYVDFKKNEIEAIGSAKDKEVQAIKEHADRQAKIIAEYENIIESDRRILANPLLYAKKATGRLARSAKRRIN